MYNHEGYIYDPWNEVQPEENIKIFHDIKTPNGETISVDWTPYETMTEFEFREWIEFGMPTRTDNDNSNFNHNDWEYFIWNYLK